MALPLPKVVSDVGPGGGLVTAMGGINALANNMHLRNINAVKAKYAPLTTQAEAASKLAYANLMAPQFIAKAMTNPGFMGNLNEDQKQAINALVFGAGTGQGSASNILGQMQQGSMGSAGNSLSGWFGDKLKSLFGQGNSQGRNPLTNPVPQQPPMQQAPMQQPSNNGENAGSPELFKAYQAWMQSPEGQAKMQQEGEGYYPDEQELMNWAQQQRAQQQSANPMEMTLTQGNRSPKTYEENTGDYKGAINQGSESGTLRARDLNDLGKQQLALSEAGTVINRMVGIIKNPLFQSMRKDIPFFQDMQLKALSKVGNKEQQKLIGDFRATAQTFAQSTVNSFKGHALQREFDMANNMKPSENDTVNVIEGKIRALKTLKDVSEKKNEIVSGLMSRGVNLGDAVRQANKMVDVSSIEKDVNELLRDKPNEEDIQYMAQKYKKSPDEIRAELKAKGLL